MAYQLNVQFSDKDEAKSLGAKWNQKQKKWFWVSGEFPEAFVQQKFGFPKNYNPQFVIKYVAAYLVKQKEVGFDGLYPRMTDALRAEIEATGTLMFKPRVAKE